MEAEKKKAEIEEVANWTRDAAREGALAYKYLKKATKLNQIGEYSVSEEADEFEAEVMVMLVETTTVRSSSCSVRRWSARERRFLREEDTSTPPRRQC